MTINKKIYKQARPTLNTIKQDGLPEGAEEHQGTSAFELVNAAVEEEVVDEQEEEEGEEEVYMEETKTAAHRARLATPKRSKGQQADASMYATNDASMSGGFRVERRGRPRKRPLPIGATMVVDDEAIGGIHGAGCGGDATTTTTTTFHLGQLEGGGVHGMDPANISGPRDTRNGGRPKIRHSPSAMLAADTFIDRNLIFVFKCPVEVCQRYYINHLGLSRHFQIYQHETVCCGMRAGGAGAAEQADMEERGGSLLFPPPPLKIVQRCPILDCPSLFDAENVEEFLVHYEECHVPALSDGSPYVLDAMQKKALKNCLKEYISLYEKLSKVEYHPGDIPDIYIEEAIHHWRFIKLFESLGPNPPMKHALLTTSLREDIKPVKEGSNVVLVNEDMLIKMIQLALFEFMPKGMLLSTSYNDCDQGVGMVQAWEDREWLDEITKQSVLSIIHGTAPYSIEKYRKNRMRNAQGLPLSLSPIESPGGTSEEGMIICQVPGCGKVFKGIAAYRYHAHHYEHDLELIIRTSTTLRSILFSADALFHEYETVQLKFPSGSRSDGGQSLSSSSLSVLNNFYCFPDAVHCIHGQMDQQLPIIMSWHFMKRRLAAAVMEHTLADDFSLVFRADEDVAAIKQELGYTRGKKARRSTSGTPPAIMMSPSYHMKKKSLLMTSVTEADLSTMHAGSVSALAAESGLSQSFGEDMGQSVDNDNHFFILGNENMTTDENGNFVLYVPSL